MTAKIKMRQYGIFVKPRNFDTADIKCFTVFNCSGSFVTVYRCKY